MSQQKALATLRVDNAHLNRSIAESRLEIEKLKSAISELNDKLKKTGKEGKKEVEKVGSGFRALNYAIRDTANMAKFFILYKAFRVTQDSILGAVDSLVKFNDEMIDLRRISGISQQQVEALGVDVINLAKQYRLVLPEAAGLTKIWVQQGKQGAELIKLMDLTALAMRGLGISAEEATDTITILKETFKMSNDMIELYLDKIKSVESNNAVMAKDLVDAYTRAGGAANAMGVSIDSLNGYVTSLTQTLRVSGQYAGNFLKVIFMRVQRPEFIKVMKEAGIVTGDTMNTLTDTEAILDLVASKWDQLSSSVQTNLAYAAGGRRRYSEFLSLMQNFDLSVKATRDSLLAFNDTQKSSEVALQKFSATMQDTRNSLIQAADTVKAADAMKGLALIVNDVANAFSNLLSNPVARWVAAATAALVTVGAFIVGGAIATKAGLFIAALTGIAKAGTITTAIISKTITTLTTLGIVSTAALGAYATGIGRSNLEKEIELIRDLGNEMEATQKKALGFSTSLSKFSMTLSERLISSRWDDEESLFNVLSFSGGTKVSRTAFSKFYNEILSNLLDQIKNDPSNVKLKAQIAEEMFNFLSSSDEEIAKSASVVRDAMKEAGTKVVSEYEKLTKNVISLLRKASDRISKPFVKTFWADGREVRVATRKSPISEKMIKNLLPNVSALNIEDVLSEIKNFDSRLYEVIRYDEELLSKIIRINELRKEMSNEKGSIKGIDFNLEPVVSENVGEFVERYLGDEKEAVNNFVKALVKMQGKLGLIPENIKDFGGYVDSLIGRVTKEFLGDIKALEKYEDKLDAAVEAFVGRDMVERIVLENRVKKRSEEVSEMLNMVDTMDTALTASNRMLDNQVRMIDITENETKLEKIKINLQKTQEKLLADKELAKQQILVLSESERTELVVALEEMDKQNEVLGKRIKKIDENIAAEKELNKILKDRKSIMSEISSEETKLIRIKDRLSSEVENIKIEREYNKILESRGRKEADIFKIESERNKLITETENKINSLKDQSLGIMDSDPVGANKILNEDIPVLEDLINLIKLYYREKASLISEDEKISKDSLTLFESIPERIRSASKQMKGLSKELNEIYVSQEEASRKFASARERYLATGSSVFLQEMNDANASLVSAAETHSQLVEQQKSLNNEMNFFKQAWDEVSDIVRNKFMKSLTDSLVEITGIDDMIGSFSNFISGKGSINVNQVESNSDIKRKGEITGQTIARILVNSQVFTGSGGRTGSILGEVGGALGWFGKKVNPIAGLLGGAIGSLFDRKKRRDEPFTGVMSVPDISNNTNALIENTSELRKMNETLINAPRGFSAPKLGAISGQAQVVVNVSGFVGNESQLAEKISEAVNKSLTGRGRMS